MTEPHRQQKPSKHKLENLALIVRPHWSKVRTFTEAQRAEAEAYAAEHGATVETMP